MRKTAAWTLLLAAGCYYDRPNPWDTSDQVEEWQAKKEADFQLEMRPPFHPPQHTPPGRVDAELEAWRDTVLATADAPTRAHLRARIQDKIAFLEKRIAELYRVDEHNRAVPLTEALEQYRVERLRLWLLDQREGRT
jgi:hypothetical protein